MSLDYTFLKINTLSFLSLEILCPVCVLGQGPHCSGVSLLVDQPHRPMVAQRADGEFDHLAKGLSLLQSYGFSF